MKLTDLAFLALSICCLPIVSPYAGAALRPSLDGLAENGDQDPEEDPCTCLPSVTASGLANCSIELYWAGGSSSGKCSDGDCPEEDVEPCKIWGTFTVVNVKDTPQTVLILPKLPGWAGTGPKTLKPGEEHAKTGISTSAACGDSVYDYIHVWDMGPFGNDCQSSVYFNCGRCQASY